MFENVSGFPRACEKGSLSAGSASVGISAASAIAGESKKTIELLEVCETDYSEKVVASAAAATAGECKGINGSLEVIESEFSAKSGAAAVVAATVGSETADQAGVLHGTSSLFLNSRIPPHGHRSRIHGSSHSSHARARAVAVAALPAGAASRSASSVVATPARFSRSFAAVVADAASACATSVHDSAFNSGSAGGLLPVCKSTSYNLEVCSQGPTGRRSSKGGVSGPAEDLRPVPEVEAGVNFRLAGRVRGQVAGSLSREATRNWYQAGQGRCGHTFPPPGGSWYPIRVAWTRQENQTIDGLDEGVWDHTIGDLGAKG